MNNRGCDYNTGMTRGNMIDYETLRMMMLVELQINNCPKVPCEMIVDAGVTVMNKKYSSGTN
jgi:hypothetical protein